MKRIAAAVALALVLALTGCGSSIDRGTITEKVVHPAYTWVQYVCSSYNSKGFCVVQTPIFHNEPERYSFDLRNEDEEGYVYVDRPTFDEYEVGDFYG